MSKTTKAAPEQPATAKAATGEVKVRVLPLGAGKVSNGQGGYKDENGRIKFGRCAKGDELTVAAKVGEALEAKGYAEIL